jgi:hypothetical protein
LTPDIQTRTGPDGLATVTKIHPDGRVVRANLFSGKFRAIARK